MHGVGRVLKHRWVARATLIGGWLTTLCVGLALVFATASAASVVDRFQHANALLHHHAADHDHPHGHSHGGDETSDEDEHWPGLGQHHSDAPTGATVRAAAPVEAVGATVPALDLESTRRVKFVRPGGLERPLRSV